MPVRPDPRWYSSGAFEAMGLLGHRMVAAPNVGLLPPAADGWLRIGGLAIWGKTFRKRAFKIKVVRDGGGPIGWAGAAKRVFVVQLASGLTFGCGGWLFALSVLFDKSGWHRGWHDKIASTVVVMD